jgi:hypothetical protein
MIAFDSQWTCDDKNSSKFEYAVDVMHMSSPWILEVGRGLSENLIGHS